MLGIFLLAAACWLAFIGTVFAGFMVLAMASVALTSVVDSARVTCDGRQARLRISHVFWGIAIVCGVYAGGGWLLSLRWERIVVNMDIVRLAPPGRAGGPVFYAGDRLLVTKSAYWSASPARGDVVLATVNGQSAVERIIAVPGDELQFAGGRFRVNGAALDEEQYPIQPTRLVELYGNAHLVALPWSGAVADGTYVVWGLQGEPEGNAIGVGPTTIGCRHIRGKVWLVYSPYRDRRIVDHANPAIAPTD
jgi:signal peptidase I